MSNEFCREVMILPYCDLCLKTNVDVFEFYFVRSYVFFLFDLFRQRSCSVYILKLILRNEFYKVKSQQNKNTRQTHEI